MTVQEAIKWLKAISVTLEMNDFHKSSLLERKEALHMGIQSMRELEQYRALGTVEQLEWCKDASHWKNLYKDKLEQYESLGTVEELKEAMELFEKTKIVGAENIIIIRKDGTYEVDGIDILDAYEKQIPKKPTEVNEIIYGTFYRMDFMCPSCDTANIENAYKPNYCKHCGQALKWGEEDD